MHAPAKLFLLVIFAAISSELFASSWSFAKSIEQSQGVIQESSEGPLIDLTDSDGLQLPEDLVESPNQDKNVFIKGEFRLNQLPEKRKGATIVGWGDRSGNSRIVIQVYDGKLRVVLCGPGAGRKAAVIKSETQIKIGEWYRF